MSDKDIMALVDKAKADRKGDAPIVAEPILQLAPKRRSSNIVPALRRRLFTKKTPS